MPARVRVPGARVVVDHIRSRAERIRALLALEFLDAEQVAYILDVHPSTVRRRLRAGELRGFQVGDVWRIRPEALDLLGRQDVRKTG